MHLPEDAEQRLRTRFGLIGPEAFRILAEVQEHGASFISTIVQDSHGRKVRLVIAAPDIKVIDSTVLAEHGESRDCANPDTRTDCISQR